MAVKKETTKKAVTKKEAPKKEAKPASKPAAKKEAPKKVIITTPIKKQVSSKTVYHVSKRDNDGREWKVFIEGSEKVIKLFNTQAEALAYAKSLISNKDDGSYVKLHGLDGKIRKV